MLHNCAGDAAADTAAAAGVFVFTNSKRLEASPMPGRRKYIPVELEPEYRAEFESGITPLEVLGARLAMSHDTFARCARELGWVPKVQNAWGRRMRLGKKTVAPPTALASAGRMSAMTRSASSPPNLTDQTVLAERLRRNVDRELAAVERMREGIDPGDLTKLEAVGRMLMGIVRTLQEITRLEQAASPQSPAKDADDFPRDYAELRRSLLQHLDAILAERESAVPGETESA